MWNLVSLDGFFEGTQSWSIDWFQENFDEDMQRYSIEQLRSVEMLAFGRVTYEGMAAYWQSAEGEAADYMNALPKIVFSQTLARADWKNTMLVKGDAAETMRELKAEGDGNIFVFGSGDLSATFTEHGLFDEYRIGVVPIVLGAGAMLFGRGGSRHKLKLLEVRALGNSVVLRYAPA